MRIYAISFQQVSNHPADDGVMEVWIQPTWLSDKDIENLVGARRCKVDAEALMAWVAELLEVPFYDEDEHVESVAIVAVHTYLERTHYYDTSLTNRLLDELKTGLVIEE